MRTNHLRHHIEGNAHTNLTTLISFCAVRLPRWPSSSIAHAVHIVDNASSSQATRYELKQRVLPTVLPAHSSPSASSVFLHRHVSFHTIDALSPLALLTLSKQRGIARVNRSPRRTSNALFPPVLLTWWLAQVLPSTIGLLSSSMPIHEYVEHFLNIMFGMLRRMYDSRQNSHKLVKRVNSNYKSGNFRRIKSRDQPTVIRLADGDIVGYRVTACQADDSL